MVPSVFSDFKGTDANKLNFRIDNIDVAVVNAIRRTILADVAIPGIAFDAHDADASDVVVKVNKTALHNEFIAHRVSLLPIRIPVGPGAPSLSHYRFVLKATGPKVTTADIKIVGPDGVELDTHFHELVFPPFRAPDGTKHYALIAKLRKDSVDGADELEVEFRARMGTGRKHARWCPVSLCSYQYVVDDKKAEEEFQERIANGKLPQGPGVPDPRSVFDSLDKQRFYIQDKFGNPISFQFSLESESSLTPGQAFNEALGTLIQRINTWTGRCEKQTMPIKFDDESGVAIVSFEGEDHTLGNLLHAMLYNMHSTTRGDGLLEYVGYTVPHPLTDEMIIKLKMVDNTKGLTGIYTFMRNALTSIARILNEFRTNFQDASKRSKLASAQTEYTVEGIPKKFLAAVEKAQATRGVDSEVSEDSEYSESESSGTETDTDEDMAPMPVISLGLAKNKKKAVPVAPVAPVKRVPKAAPAQPAAPPADIVPAAPEVVAKKTRAPRKTKSEEANDTVEKKPRAPRVAKADKPDGEPVVKKPRAPRTSKVVALDAEAGPSEVVKKPRAVKAVNKETDAVVKKARAPAKPRVKKDVTDTEDVKKPAKPRAKKAENVGTE
jgi:DNA-directed RNA polymerase subunit L